MLMSHLETFLFVVQQTPELTVFLSRDVEQRGALTVRQHIVELPEVESVRIIDPDEALNSFEEQTGHHVVANYVQDNPFPITVVIQPTRAHRYSQHYEQLSNYLYGLNFVELVHFDIEWVKKLSLIQDVARVLIWALATTLLFVAVFLICNATRQQVAERVDEIKVFNTLGASRRFICRRSVYTAFWQTVLIFIVTFIMVNGLLNHLRVPLAELTAGYDISIPTLQMQWTGWLTVVGAVLILKITTAKISVNAYLRMFEKEDA